MSDVSAILLSLGEASTAAARQHLEAQTRPLAAIHLVENISPFARAFQAGLEQVRTEFFLQCDADMLLGPHCLERLAATCDDSTALAVGQLEDPLQGAIYGVKLFRTRACHAAGILAEANCEIRQTDRLQKLGWSVRSLSEVLGSHQLDPRGEAYQFERFRILGCKAVYREGWWDATHRLSQLGRRLHLNQAAAAAAGLLAGLTVSEPDQIHGPLETSQEYAFWCSSTAPPEDPPEARAPFFESGWSWGFRQRQEHGCQPRRTWLSHYLQNRSAGDWLFLAGYLAACLDPQERSASELWPRLSGWAEALPRHLPGV